MLQGFAAINKRLSNRGVLTGLWSLWTGHGEAGGYNTGEVTFYPYENVGRGGKSFSRAEGDHKKFWGSFYAVTLALAGAPPQYEIDLDLILI